MLRAHRRDLKPLTGLGLQQPLQRKHKGRRTEEFKGIPLTLWYKPVTSFTQ